MKKPANKTSNLEQLIQRKQELQTFCAYQEKLISYKFEAIKSNIPEILANEILPYTPEKNSDISSVLNMANDFIIRFLPERYRKNKIVGVALKLVEVLIIRGVGNRGKVKGEKVNIE